jgi:hypothetical protein
VLFLDEAVYQWRAKDELCLAAYNTGRAAESWRIATGLLDSPELPETERERVTANRKLAEILLNKSRTVSTLTPAQ